MKLKEQNVLSEQPHANMSRKRKHVPCMRKFRLTTETSQNKSKSPEQKQKWNAYMKLYKKKRFDKKNPGFECEIEIQSSDTVENLTTGCQNEIYGEATTKETMKGNGKNPSFECENEIQSSGTVDNPTTGCQGEICEQATTKETKKGNGKNMDDVIKRFHNIVSQGPL